MIDWLTAVVAVPDELRDIEWHQMAGYTLYARPGGEIERIEDRWLEIRGTYDAGMRVRLGCAGLWLSGNPVKLLTGQNVDGPDDVGALLASVLLRVNAALSLPCSISFGPTRMTRVDITYSLDLGAIERVREVLRVASLTATARHQGRSQTAHQTVYLGRHSRRHSVKLYAKADELRSHPPKGIPPYVADELHEQAAGLLRIEVTLRRQELRDIGMEDVYGWCEEGRAYQVWQSYWGRVGISAAMDLMQEETLALPNWLRGTYELWRRGADVAEMMSRASYYRHRRALLERSDGACDVAVLRTQDAASPVAEWNVGEWLHNQLPWKASGRLAQWIEETAA